MFKSNSILLQMSVDRYNTRLQAIQLSTVAHSNVEAIKAEIKTLHNKLLQLQLAMLHTSVSVV